MERGIFLNLFEVNLPTLPIPVMSRPLQETNYTYSLDEEVAQAELEKMMLPTFLYASQETGKLFAYGENAQQAQRFGFNADQFDPVTDPRFTSRLIIDSVVHHLITKLGFELQMRPHIAKVYELVDKGNKLRRIKGRIDVYPSYNIQTVFLKVANNLRYFLMINPKVRYQFVHALSEIQQSVDCTGRLLRLSCPSECNVYDCDLYDFRGKLAGKFVNKTEVSSFKCRFNQTSSNATFIQLDERARFAFPIPIEVCEVEASVANIKTLISKRIGQEAAASMASELRVVSGDLLPNHRINTEVGRKRYDQILSLINRLKDGVKFFSDVELLIEHEPVRAIEGGFAIDDIYFE